MGTDEWADTVAEVRALAEIRNELSVRDRKFADSLILSFESKGELSDKQRHWARKLTEEGSEIVNGPTANPQVDADAIFGLFDLAAKSGLMYPALRYDIEGATVKLKRAGEGSKHPGTINIFVKGGWWGRVMMDGELVLTNPTPDIIAALTELIEHPLTAAVERGQRMGLCCFCGHLLATKESLSAGYGPVCADRWGLPWGQVKEDEPLEFPDGDPNYFDGCYEEDDYYGT